MTEPWAYGPAPRWPPEDMLPPLPVSLAVDSCIHRRCPAALAKGSARDRVGPSVKQQLNPANPAFLADEMTWMIGVIPPNHARKLLLGWRTGGVCPVFVDELAAMVLERMAGEKRRAAG